MQNLGAVDIGEKEFYEPLRLSVYAWLVSVTFFLALKKYLKGWMSTLTDHCKTR